MTASTHSNLPHCRHASGLALALSATACDGPAMTNDAGPTADVYVPPLSTHHHVDPQTRLAGPHQPTRRPDVIDGSTASPANNSALLVDLNLDSPRGHRRIRRRRAQRRYPSAVRSSTKDAVASSIS